MLKSSRCSVVFPINGLALSSEITFQPGITAVVGRNGTGKTFKTIELWRYLLFGKKALRGPASDYKNLDAEGVVAIKGVDYLIKRSPRGESIRIGDEEPLAVGADAVNKKVVELLGFGLDVFDITNASVQKQATRLTQLTPAKRKELIDEVIGLTQNEKVEKDCKEKAKLLKLEADTIRENITQPTTPIEPDGYRDSKELGTELAMARKAEARRKEIENLLNTGMTSFPKPRQVRQDVASLDAHETLRLRIESRRASLEQQIDAIPVTTLTKEQVKQAQAWVQYDAEIARRGEKPTISLTECKAALDTWNHIFALEKINTEVECPKCEHRFTPARSTPEKPLHSASFYGEQRRRNEMWEKPLVEPTGARLPKDELEKGHLALARAEEREQLAEELAALPELANKHDELVAARQLEIEWTRYETHEAAQARLRQQQDEARDELKTLPPPVDVEALDELFVKARVYESEQKRFEQDGADYIEKMRKATDLIEEATGYTKGATRLAEARREVKAYLAPSLSRIASSLISEMTCGRLNLVQVDDDMNITVDGQDVVTLSGAGETAANLAMRLALGRTLVGGVFPVFLGDEIDADADEERSEATFECLRNLRSQFDQVIIITHKPHVVADHVIDFDE